MRFCKLLLGNKKHNVLCNS